MRVITSRIPNRNLIGGRNRNSYHWSTFKNSLYKQIWWIYRPTWIPECFLRENGFLRTPKKSLMLILEHVPTSNSSWMVQQPTARLIDSWSSSKSNFWTQFLSSTKGGRIMVSLMTVRQRYNESLREYLSRFRTEVDEKSNLIDDLAFNYLAKGPINHVIASSRRNSLKINPRTLQAALQIFDHWLTL